MLLLLLSCLPNYVSSVTGKIRENVTVYATVRIRKGLGDALDLIRANQGSGIQRNRTLTRRSNQPCGQPCAVTFRMAITCIAKPRTRQKGETENAPLQATRVGLPPTGYTSWSTAHCCQDSGRMKNQDFGRMKRRRTRLFDSWLRHRVR
jgi:hypothetical protein